MADAIYGFLPLTPEDLEDDYRTRQARASKCGGCEVRKNDFLEDLRKDWVL